MALILKNIDRNLEHRFARKHSVSLNGCWLWIAAVNAKGYGLFSSGVIKSKQAHRFAYEFYIGPIPEGHGVLHHCDNPSCVNPDHLFTGGQLVNLRDMSAKGRWRNQFMDRKVCAQGHPLMAGNLNTSPSIPAGRKICRTCNLNWRRKNRRKNQ